MLRKIAAALVATALLAGPALAQTAGNGAAAASVQAPAASMNGKTTKTVAHTTRHVRKHVARAKTRKAHLARHFKINKTHHARLTAAAKRA